jgi:hypothetical protein
MRFLRLRRVFVVLFFVVPVLGQSPDGTINGIVVDPSSKAIATAEIIGVNDVTGVRYTTKTNEEGIYVLPNLPPGPYRLQISKVGFKTLIKPDIVLNVQDALSINFTLPVGAVFEVMTVEGGAPLVNTESAAVSTIIDRKYIENMPLNGRSFQDLILLTAGVVTNSPQQASSVGATGEFSVNGQRTESNYYTVDGVSANTGAAAADTRAGLSGAVTAASALGTTQPLASVDALQEFRVQSSTYSAEYGRSPGGQFSFVTRSGTSQWHGSAFDYLRNDYLDANNWFNNYYGQAEPPLRQNDFGGVLGGPVQFPALFTANNKTFFFFSYEGLRLIQPQASTVSFVPDSSLRQAQPPLGQALNAFPVANGPSLGNGLAEFIGSWPNPSSIDAYSIRLDHNFGDRLKAFFRFSDTPSTAVSRLTGNIGVPSTRQTVLFTSRTYTFGLTSVFSTHVNNDFRMNYSSNLSNLTYGIENFAGAQAVNLAQIQGINPASGAYFVTVALSFGNDIPTLLQGIASTRQRQWNVTDSLSLSFGRHALKLGFDYRRLAPLVKPGGTQVGYYFSGPGDVQNDNPAVVTVADSAAFFPIYTNFSAYAQDDWKITPRLNLSLGLRWEVNPAPGVSQGQLPYTVVGAENLTTMKLAPQGTLPWKTTWYNFAPRLGVSYLLSKKSSQETIISGGGGLFFDTGQQLGSLGFSGPGFSSLAFLGYSSGAAASFPIPISAVPAIEQVPSPPYSEVFAYAPHLQLPYTLEWNLTVGQALGNFQALSLSYVGSHASRLLQENELAVAPFNPNFTYMAFFKNGLTADYQAFQAHFQRRLNQNLTALAAYTWSHSIDYGSQNLSLPYVRGNSDFDVRQNLSFAFSYDLPSVSHNRFGQSLLGNWGIDDRFTARTGFPITLNGLGAINPGTGQIRYAGLDLNPEQPVYVEGSACAAIYNNGLSCPGGRAVNPNAFSFAPNGQTGNAPRNFVRGFGAWQMDLAVRRDFPIHERLKLQFRAEAFNIFNHPNFGFVNPYLGQPTFGQATATLNTSLGTLNPLYQMGGPRSLQFALKLLF